MWDALAIVGMVVWAFAIVLYIRHHAPRRHARYRMRARLAAWLMDGKLRPVGQVKNGRLVQMRQRAARRAAERRHVLSVVRRNDPGSGAA
jgi:hypothetical protein